MATIDTVLKLQDKMSAQLDRIEKSANKVDTSFKKVSISVENVDKQMQKSEKASSSFFSSLLKFEILKSVFNSVFGLIMGNLDSAIARFDTLQNYTRVMSNLGIAEEDALASKERLKEGLQGLPTALDAGVAAVQRFVSANGDIEASTEMYLAMNNAILAGGATMDVQRSAMEQLAQAYAKGKPDMMEWRALLSAMPAQLGQIAKAMGVTTTELGEDLRSGKVSMNDFMKTAIQLNQEGVDGFASFAEQAENSTKGIQTAIANMQSAIARGWEGLITKANESLEASGLPTIETIIKNVGLAIEETMNRLGEEAIPTLATAMADLGNTFNQIDQGVGEVTNHALQGLDVLDFFLLGVKAVVLGIDVIYNGLKTFCIAAKYTFLQIGTDINTFVFNIANGIEDTIMTAAHNVEDFLNGIIRGLNSLVDAFNQAFSFINMHANKIQELTFTTNLQGTIDKFRKENYLDAGFINALNTMTDDAYNELVEQSNAATGGWSRQVGDLQNLVSTLKDATQKTQVDAKTRAGTYDYNKLDSLMNSMNSVKGTDSTGGSAIKTTTDDDLLKDEDIQLLLDVATRDYKLTYQQVTPNITLTFGDIRETADVDAILDEVADRLEEIYDSNLEVATVND